MTSRLRVGITGSENSHADEIATFVERGPYAGRLEVVGITGDDVSRRKTLSDRLSAADSGPDPMSLLGCVDALIVCERNGDRHASIAGPYLEQGTPVHVDKPFACTAADARQMISAAERGDTFVTSASPLRYLPLVDRAAHDIGRGRGVLGGGARPRRRRKPLGGLHFYGSHHADVALRLVPGAVPQPIVRRVGDEFVAEFAFAGATVRLRFTPQPGPFSLCWGDVGAIAGGHIETRADFMWPTLEAFVDGADSGVWPIGSEDLVRPVRAIESVVAALTDLW